jgi:hypothetical protein
MALVDTLKQIEESPEIKPTEWLTEGYEHELHGLLQKALDEADSELITDSGTPNWAAMDALEAEGFRITKGESDSFGWLSGVIHASKGGRLCTDNSRVKV